MVAEPSALDTRSSCVAATWMTRRISARGSAERRACRQAHVPTKWRPVKNASSACGAARADGGCVRFNGSCGHTSACMTPRRPIPLRSASESASHMKALSSYHVMSGGCRVLFRRNSAVRSRCVASTRASMVVCGTHSELFPSTGHGRASAAVPVRHSDAPTALGMARPRLFLVPDTWQMRTEPDGRRGAYVARRPRTLGAH